MITGHLRSSSLLTLAFSGLARILSTQCLGTFTGGGGGGGGGIRIINLLFVFNVTIEGPRAPAVKPGHTFQSLSHNSNSVP
jgi:hypothetical protein